LASAKADATLLALKEQEDSGIEIVTNGAQFVEAMIFSLATTDAAGHRGGEAPGIRGRGGAGAAEVWVSAAGRKRLLIVLGGDIISARVGKTRTGVITH
jgi:hypothetical protein